jgi:protein-disulfide isomerase
MNKIGHLRGGWFLAIAIVGVGAGVYFFLMQPRGLKPNSKVGIEVLAQPLDLVYGPDTAPDKLVVFISYQCAWCQKFLTETFPQLKSHYIDNGKLQLVVKLVQPSTDPNAELALQMLVCLNQAGNPQPLQTLLLTEPNVVYTREFMALNDEFLHKDAAYAHCMATQQAKMLIDSNLVLFRELNLTGTPTIIYKRNIYKGFKTYAQMVAMLN